jgi:hypothetical protein
MNEVLLNGLAHLFINRDLKLDYDKVIDLFGGSHNRRMKFDKPKTLQNKLSISNCFFCLQNALKLTCVNL